MPSCCQFILLFLFICSIFFGILYLNLTQGIIFRFTFAGNKSGEIEFETHFLASRFGTGLLDVLNVLDFPVIPWATRIKISCAERESNRKHAVVQLSDIVLSLGGFFSRMTGNVGTRSYNRLSTRVWFPSISVVSEKRTASLAIFRKRTCRWA
jgi:hypothetical protein